MIVLDANILIRGVLGRRVRQLIDTYAGQGVRFFAPDVAFDDAEKYLPPLLKKRGKPHDDVSATLEYLRNIIEPVTPELYAVFESEARQRLRDRDENDWPILATALGLACAVWTEDADFFGTGVRVKVSFRKSNYDHARMTDSVPVALTVANVPTTRPPG
jgi:predicted nucleic acid-binding protein